MIINIRGTSGSGKTVLANRVMEFYRLEETLMVGGRRQPIGYVYGHPNGGNFLGVVGHYESPCGGADTVGGRNQLFDKIREFHFEGHDVLVEGLLLSDEFNRTAALHQDGIPLLILVLNTSLEVCLESINARRKKKNPCAKLVNPKKTGERIKIIDSAVRRLRLKGVRVEVADREEAFCIVSTQLRIGEGVNATG